MNGKKGDATFHLEKVVDPKKLPAAAVVDLPDGAELEDGCVDMIKLEQGLDSP